VGRITTAAQGRTAGEGVQQTEGSLVEIGDHRRDLLARPPDERTTEVLGLPRHRGVDVFTSAEGRVLAPEDRAASEEIETGADGGRIGAAGQGLDDRGDRRTPRLLRAAAVAGGDLFQNRDGKDVEILAGQGQRRRRQRPLRQYPRPRRSR
jgi:hypothetical protein